jgi:hypothetical protein
VDAAGPVGGLKGTASADSVEVGIGANPDEGVGAEGVGLGRNDLDLTAASNSVVKGLVSVLCQ